MSKNRFYFIVIIKGKEVDVLKTMSLFTNEMYSISTGEPEMNNADEEIVHYTIFTYGEKKSILHNGWKMESNGTITIGKDNVFRIETIVTNYFNVRMVISERILYDDYSAEFIVEDLFEAIIKTFFSLSSTGVGRFDYLCLKKEQFCTKWKHVIDSGVLINRELYEKCSKESNAIEKIHNRISKMPQLIGNQKDYYRYLVKASVKISLQVGSKLLANYPHAFDKSKRKTLKKK